MASIAFSPIVSNARGKVGGIVFTRGHSTPTVRLRVKPRNPRTTAQSSVRSNLTDASRAYKALGSSDLADWRAYALTLTKHNPVSGTAYHPSPGDVFVSLATKFLQATPGGSIPTSPPADPYDGDTTVITPTGGSGQISFAATDDQTAGSTTEILLQKLASPARVPQPNAYVHADFWVADNGTPFVLTGLTAGTYSVAIKFVQLADGQQTQLLVLGTVTVS